MPFGLTNSPAIFQCLMNSSFAPFMRKFMLVFMDDILIYRKSLAKYVQHLTQIFKFLRAHKLFIKFKKCAFAQPQTDYLGHIISAKGVATDPTKISAMLHWLTPQSLTELRGFHRLTEYYQKIVKDYGIMAKPLTNLLQHKNFTWTDVSQEVVESLKKVMCSTPIMALLNFELHLS
jgi:hypothetical protein